MKDTSWEDSSKWYDSCVGSKGHYYHEAIVLKGASKLLKLKSDSSLLDVGCGQGVFQRHLPKGIHYVGIDNSKTLLKMGKAEKAHFYHQDACEPYELEKQDFDAAAFILSLQNMQNPEMAIEQASKHLKKRGKILLILNHPCFRIPRQSSWGVDPKKKMQYRRLDSYMSSLEVPIQTHPSKGKSSEITYSFHHPLSAIVSWLSKSNFGIRKMEEWCSDKTSTGAKAKMENRARSEFPLFLAILAEKI